MLHTSDICKLTKTIQKDDVLLFMQFFIPDNLVRYNELKETMVKNVTNPTFDKIYLLNERYYTKEELGVENTKKNEYMKIIQVNIKKRASYKNYFDYINKENIKGYIVIANSDIFFDNTMTNILKTNIKNNKAMFSLVRYEYTNKNLKKCRLFGEGRADSQDTWIIHSNFIPKKTTIFNFNLGVPGCDNKLVYLFLILGYKVFNDPLLIKTYHNHSSQTRNYNGFINYPHCYITPNLPTKNHISKMVKNTHALKDLKNIEEHTDYFDKMVYNDHTILIDYLNKKIKNKENFVIPRIAGAENNFIHVIYMLNKKLDNKLFNLVNGTEKILNESEQKKLEDELHYSGIKNYLGTMKNNAGIYVTGTYPLTKYCIDYLKAFQNCELFLGWEHWGNVYKYIIDSHNFIESKFSSKQQISALTMDIFHHIHNPWTWCLKGKKILIVSSFVDSIKDKIGKNIYGVDLFPDCTFVYIKPPQTQGKNNSNDYYLELEPFYTDLENMKDDFDIALCSCGGYGNIVANYIYNMGKSSIYVGGVLQMFFGIYGSRWLRERKEVMQLYLNENWSRPSNNEKPDGHKHIEKNAYW